MIASIPFGAWMPDQPAHTPGIMTAADGVYPMAKGYRPCGQWEEVLSELAADPKGGASFTSPQGISSIIAGTDTALYRGQSGAWEQIGSGYSLQEEGRWRFAQFGGLAIATNGSDPMQKIDLTDHSVEALGGSPPKFAMLAVVKDFLVGGVLDGDIMSLGWSGINNAEWWTIAQRQCDTQRLPDGGGINGIFSGESGLILQRNCLRRMEYVGGNVIFDLSVASNTIGCVSVHTAAQWGRLGFFWSDEGPMMWDGAEVTPIGDEVVNRYIKDNYDKTAWPLMSTAIDPVQGVVKWALPDRMLVYDWRLQRWTTLPFVSPIIFSGVTRDISIDEQDPAVGSPDDTVDSVGLLSFDDPSFKGGDPRLYAFSSDNALGTLTGTPMAATLTTGDAELVSGREARSRFARPVTDAVSGMTLTMTSKARLGDAGSATAYSSLAASGDMPIRERARFTRGSLGIAAGTAWTYAEGLELELEAGARR